MGERPKKAGFTGAPSAWPSPASTACLTAVTGGIDNKITDECHFRYEKGLVTLLLTRVIVLVCGNQSELLDSQSGS